MRSLMYLRAARDTANDRAVRRFIYFIRAETIPGAGRSPRLVVARV